MAPSYQCAILPCDYKSVTRWAAKFIEFRLEALKTAPSGSLSSLEVESSISLDDWVSILSQPAFRVTLCVSTTTSGDEKGTMWYDNEWVGILFLYSPLYNFKEQEDFLETRWYLGGAFVSPKHRGRRVLGLIFKHIVLEGIEELEELAQEKEDDRFRPSSRWLTRIQALADTNDTPKIKYYALAGMNQTQTMTAAEYIRTGWSFPISHGQEDREVAVLERVFEKTPLIKAHL